MTFYEDDGPKPVSQELWDQLLAWDDVSGVPQAPQQFDTREEDRGER